MKLLKEKKGMATIEVLPLLILFIILFSYGLGLFGFIHTGILHSIAARNYAFEVIRNRSDISYFDGGTSRSSSVAKTHFSTIGYRYFAIKKIGVTEDEFYAQTRNIAFGPAFHRRAIESHQESGEIATTVLDHVNKVNAIGQRNRSIGVSPGWVMVAYGICVNSTCGQ
ncbi:MAG: hypothetical protein HOO06_02160 [Bdellovibrionaceae bacterium]|nr:hypothetical protein [Pseudobdellovibrionaceae bacterium]